MSTAQARRARYLSGAVLLLGLALLYWLTLDNGLRPEELTGGDLITHQYAQVQARPGNAPGYPLYTMGGWLWFRLGNRLLGWALNPIEVLSLYSTLWALASLLVLYLILLRVTRQNWPIAGLLTAFYGVTFFFWYYSVTTEQYTSAVFQTLVVIWLAFKWDDRPRDSMLLWLALITGTMLANMVTTLLILPPLLWFILFRRDEFSRRFMLSTYLARPGFVFAAAGLALLPLLSYIYVYIRGAQHPEWRGQGNWNSTWAWFVQFLTIQQGRDELAPGLTLHSFFTAEFPALLWQELTWLVLLGGLVGLAWLGRRRAIFLSSTLALYLIFSWGYRFGNWYQVIIPAYPIFIIGFAAGLVQFTDWTSQRFAVVGRQPLGVYGGPLTILLLTGLLMYRLSASLPAANQRNRPDDTGLQPGWAILADRPETPALVSGSFEEKAALEYLQTVWQVAADIYPTRAGDLQSSTDRRQIDRRRYITRQAAMVAPAAVRGETIYPQAAGVTLIALWPEPRRQLPGGVTPLDLEFGDQLRLAGWEIVKIEDTALENRLNHPNWQLALYWQARQPIPMDYTISVRPLAAGQMISAEGEAIIQDHQPVWGFYPTSRWRPAELVRDVYALSLPASVTPDAVQIVVYRTTATGFENLAEATIQISNEPMSQ
jgi:hypothetical protein